MGRERSCIRSRFVPESARKVKDIRPVVAWRSDHRFRRLAHAMLDRHGEEAFEIAIELVRARQAAGEFLAAAIWIGVAVKISYVAAATGGAERLGLDRLRPFVADPAIRDRLHRGHEELGLSASHVLVDLGTA
jgi:hypothetical protein